MWVQIAIWVISTLIAYALSPKPEQPKPASLEDFQIPTADPTRSIPVVFGKVWIEDPNIVWWGHLRTKKIKKDGGMFHSDVTVGYKYYLGVHAALCYPVDRVLKFTYGERLAWSGDVSTGSISVSQPELFGGDDKEGGFEGTIEFLSGESTQTAPAYLTSLLGSPMPGFRGVLTALFHQCYWGNSPYLKNPGWLVQRTLTHVDKSLIWYNSKAEVNGYLNPAHIVYEILTQPWAMGYPTARINDANFKDAADTLYAEGTGLCMKWSRSEPIEAFLLTVLDHFGAVVDQNPTNGLFELTLIRADYTPSALPLLSPSNSNLDKFERHSYASGETVNVFTVVYHDWETNTDLPATVHNLANIQAQGAIVEQSISLPGIPDYDQAATMAFSLLKSRSASLARLELSDVSRVNYELRRGSVFRYTNSRLGLDSVVFRVLDVQYGTLESGKITIVAVEDVFGVTSNSYSQQQASGWTLPGALPEAVTYQLVQEASYRDILLSFTSLEIAALPTDFGILTTVALPANLTDFAYALWTSDTATVADYTYTGVEGGFPSYAQLDGALTVYGSGVSPIARTISYKNPDRIEDVVTPCAALIGTEVVLVNSINTTAQTMSISLGCLDTLPQDHADESYIIFYEGELGADLNPGVSTDTRYARLLTKASLGTLDINDAVAAPLTFDNRYLRPYPPGGLKINTAYYPEAIEGALALQWYNRSRTGQGTELIPQSAANYGPETNALYTLRLYDENDSLVRTVADTSATTYNWTSEVSDSGQLNGRIRLELETIRDGVHSKEMHDVTINRAGYGLQYGNYYGGL